MVLLLLYVIIVIYLLSEWWWSSGSTVFCVMDNDYLATANILCTNGLTKGVQQEKEEKMHDAREVGLWI